MSYIDNSNYPFHMTTFEAKAMKNLKRRAEKTSRSAPTRPATPQETALLSELHAEISAAQTLRNELEEEKKKLKEQNNRLREKEKELESEIKSAESKLMEVNRSLTTKSAENSAADLVLKQKEQILFDDFSDLVVHDSWLKGTVSATASHKVTHWGEDFTLCLLRTVETGWIIKKTKTFHEEILIFANVPKQLSAEFSLKTKRLALAVNQKIARRANLSPESTRTDDYGADFDPLEEFKRQNKIG